MKRPIVYILCCVMLGSCSVPKGIRSNLETVDEKGEARLYTIAIKLWGKDKFSGLLALRMQPQRLSYVILDATGVKLIDAEVSSSGDHQIVFEAGPMKTSSFPEVLSTSLYRMFLIAPKQYPCSEKMFVSLCVQQTDKDILIKKMRIWPFTVWEMAESEVNNSATFLYCQPWIGLEITLKELNKER